MKVKTHHNNTPNHDLSYHDELSPPSLTKSPSMTKLMSTASKKKRSSLSASGLTKKSNYDDDYDDGVTMSNSNVAKWSLGSLMAALPLSPSPVCSSQSTVTVGTNSPASPVASQFFTPSHQNASVFSSLSFRKQELSPKRLSMSTLYESAIDQGYNKGAHEIRLNNPHKNYVYSPRSLADSAAACTVSPYDNEPSAPTNGDGAGRSHSISFPSLPPALEAARRRQRSRENGMSEQSDKVTPVKVELEEVRQTPVNRPKPYQEFLDEVQKHQHKAQLNAWKNAAYTDLVDKLRSKEIAIERWEADQRSKAEFQLDRVERKLAKKRAKAEKKMHQKVEEARIEAEKRKTREKQLVLKELDDLSAHIRGSKGRETMAHTWCCYSSGSEKSLH